MGFFSFVGKIFKSVVNVVKKIAPIVLAAAAVYFTAGAALTGGGFGTAAWTQAASAFTSGTLGLSGTLGSVVSGALTQAGFGAAIGAGVSAITGGNIMKGAQMGALTGAVTGGIGGYMNAPQVGAAGAADAATKSGLEISGQVKGLPDTTVTGSYATLEPPVSVSGVASDQTNPFGLLAKPSEQGPYLFEKAAGAPAVIPSGAGPATGASTGPLMAKAVTDQAGNVIGHSVNGALLAAPAAPLPWWQSPMVGSAIGGVGTGLMSAAKGGDDAEAALERQKQEQAYIAKNYAPPTSGAGAAGYGGAIGWGGPAAGQTGGLMPPPSTPVSQTYPVASAGPQKLIFNPETKQYEWR